MTIESPKEPVLMPDGSTFMVEIVGYQRGDENQIHCRRFVLSRPILREIAGYHFEDMQRHRGKTYSMSEPILENIPGHEIRRVLGVRADYAAYRVPTYNGCVTHCLRGDGIVCPDDTCDRENGVLGVKETTWELRRTLRHGSESFGNFSHDQCMARAHTDILIHGDVGRIVLVDAENQIIYYDVHSENE